MEVKETFDISRISSRELTIFLLKLVAAGTLVGLVFVAPGIGILSQYFPGANRSGRQRVKRTLLRLHDNGYVRYDKNNLETKAVLTADGDVYMNEELLFDLSFDKPKKWNGKWFVVMFDIKNKPEKVRKLFTIKLKEIGFEMYQDSVYVFPYKCGALIRDITKILGLRKYVKTMVVSKIDDEGELKTLFNL